MKLAKLLGAGKSFFGGQELVSYRENKHVYLPKFHSAKNPFTPKPKEAAAVTMPKEVPAPVAAKAAPTPAPVASKPGRKAGWADKLNPFRAPQPDAAPMVNAVQPELSLDAVKVLHNDLSDADVEVVPVKSRPAVPAKAAASGPMDFMSEPVLRTI
jgi:hypothetical protein